jgi:hypothetical protein
MTACGRALAMRRGQRDRLREHFGTLVRDGEAGGVGVLRPAPFPEPPKCQVGLGA